MKSHYHDKARALLSRERRRRRQRPHGRLRLHKSLLMILHRHVPLKISFVSIVGHIPPDHRKHLLCLSSRISIFRIVCRGPSTGQPSSISAAECREQTRHHAGDQRTKSRETGADNTDVAFDSGPGCCGDVIVCCRHG